MMKAYGFYYYYQNKYIWFGYADNLFETINEIISLYLIKRPYDKVIVRKLYFDECCNLKKSKILFTKH